MRLLKIVLCMAAVTAITITLVPTPADGLPLECLLCDVSQSRGVWGHGATCSAATADLFAQAAAIPAQVCNSQFQGACGIPFTQVTTSCYSSHHGPQTPRDHHVERSQRAVQASPAERPDSLGVNRKNHVSCGEGTSERGPHKQKGGRAFMTHFKAAPRLTE